MICPKCSGETRVVESRKHVAGDDVGLRRRRECIECRERFATLEMPAVLTRQSVGRSEASIAKRRARDAARRAQRTADQVKADNQRDRLRRMARIEAAATGRPIEQILSEWRTA